MDKLLGGKPKPVTHGILRETEEENEAINIEQLIEDHVELVESDENVALDASEIKNEITNIQSGQSLLKSRYIKFPKTISKVENASFVPKEEVLDAEVDDESVGEKVLSALEKIDTKHPAIKEETKKGVKVARYDDVFDKLNHRCMICEGKVNGVEPMRKHLSKHHGHVSSLAA